MAEGIGSPRCSWVPVVTESRQVLALVEQGYVRLADMPPIRHERFSAALTVQHALDAAFVASSRVRPAEVWLLDDQTGIRVSD